MLFDTHYNPVPSGAQDGYFFARDGTRLRYGLFPARASTAVGTVIIVPGRLSFIEKYFEVIETFSALGFDVAMFDLRGQGASQRGLNHQRKHFVASFDAYVSDLRMFMDCYVIKNLRGPFFVFGHSAGALIALLAEPELKSDLNAIVCVTPVVNPPTARLALQRVTADLLCSIGLGSRYAGSAAQRHPKFEENNFTTSRRRFERTRQLETTFPDLTIGAPTIGYLRSALRALEAVNRKSFRAGFHTPTLFISAAKDEIVSTPAIAAYAKLLPVVEHVMIDDALHDLPQEGDMHRDRMFEAIDAFFRRHRQPRQEAIAGTDFHDDHSR